MGIKEDIQTLIDAQEQFYGKDGRYVQALPTPSEMPVKDATTSFTKLSKPSDESKEITFTPTAKDYQFRVDVWKHTHKDKTSQGFVVTAKRDLGDGIVEIITSEQPEI